jgi:hypothetical protein
LTICTFISLVFLCANPAGSPSVPNAIANFENVPRTFTQVPFWFWNGPLDPNQYREQLKQMNSKGVYAAMPHPRFGMDRRQYLEGPFWHAMTAAIDEAKKLDMQIWLYDEYNWPSGGAGGRVTDGHPELYPRGLDYCVRNINDGPLTVSIANPKPTEASMERFEKIVRGFIKKNDAPVSSYEPWGEIIADGSGINGPVAEGQWNVLVFFQCLGRNPSILDHGSNSMTDYLSAEPVARFLALTHDQYYKRFGGDFGGTIPAIFTDESSTTSPAPFPWTEHFAEEFKARRGMDILDSLPLLLDPDSEAGSKLRLAYWQTVTDLFAEGFMGHCASWCGLHGIKLMGHIYEEDIRSYAHAAQLMTVLGRMDIPGFDALGPRCPAHNAKVAISVAQLDEKDEALCESMGLAGGWNCTMDMLRTGYNGLGIFGVSRFVPHAFFQTLDNSRVECPPSFFRDNPYWKYYKKIADLSARLSYFNHIGRHVAPCAVYYPIESLWADSVGGKGQNVLPWQHRTEGNGDAARTCTVFNDLIDGLFARRWDMDVVDDHLLAGSTVKASKICIGPEEFRVLIVPPVTAIGAKALETIDGFLQQGGEVVWIERLPRLTWPISPSQPQATLQKWFGSGKPEIGQVVKVGKGRLALLPGNISRICDYLEKELGPEIAASGDLESLRVEHRRTRDTDYFLLFNDSDGFIAGQARLGESGSPVLIDMDTGRAYSGVVSRGGSRTALTNSLEVRLRPHQSMCVIYSADKPVPSGAEGMNLPTWSCERPRGEKLDLSQGWSIQLVGSELDNKWESSIGATSIELPIFRVKKRQFKNIPGWTNAGYSDAEWDKIHILRGNGLFTDNSSILMRTELPPGTAALKRPLPVTGEYALWVNGKLIEKNIGPRFSDKGPIELKDLLTGSHDILALETYSHSGPAGLSGPIELFCGPAKIDRLKSWQELGFGFYSGRVLYRKTLDIDDRFKRAWLDLGQVQHYVEVFVNGQFIDTLAWLPYELDVTKYLTEGKNELVLVTANSIANRFAWDVWGTRGSAKAEPSGILGPAYLWLEK